MSNILRAGIRAVIGILDRREGDTDSVDEVDVEDERLSQALAAIQHKRHTANRGLFDGDMYRSGAQIAYMNRCRETKKAQTKLNENEE